jgi:hypothetical protein
MNFVRVLRAARSGPALGRSGTDFPHDVEKRPGSNALGMLAKIDGFHGDRVLGRNNGNNLPAIANPHENARARLAG